MASATSTVEHHIHNKLGPSLMPRFPGAADAIAEIERLAPGPDSFRVHFGPIASGDEDVIDLERRRILRERTGALAVAWEGAGGARACQFSGVPFLEIRGVTDSANPDAPGDFRANLSTAIEHVAALVLAWAGRPA